MKKRMSIAMIWLLLSCVLLGGCGESEIPDDAAETAALTEVSEEEMLAEEDDISKEETNAEKEEAAPVRSGREAFALERDSGEPSEEKSQSQTIGAGEVTEFHFSDVPAYSGSPYAAVNGNVPYFADSELSETSYETYSNLDSLGRCGVCVASVGLDLMPTEERGEIGDVKPSGWNQAKYAGVVDGNYLYNRCHLIGYQLSGENANTKNLITGTRYMNTEGMLPFENMVADYVKETGNHVMYRVTPVFDGDNLLAGGVLMEAESVEDGGEGILYCVYVFNVQPGIGINYADGSSWLEEEAGASPQTATEKKTETAVTGTAEETETEKNPETAEEPKTAAAQSTGDGTAYILNTNTHKFHYPSCSSVGQMSEKNKQEYTGSREEIIAMGYDPCKRCNP